VEFPAELPFWAPAPRPWKRPARPLLTASNATAEVPSLTIHALHTAYGIR
jgi:hypothetical protein